MSEDHTPKTPSPGTSNQGTSSDSAVASEDASRNDASREDRAASPGGNDLDGAPEDGTHESAEPAEETSPETASPAATVEPKDGDSSSRPAQGEDIVVGEGKTLSDYLEEEPEEPKEKEEDGGDYRSVSNVANMVVPPPGGLGRPSEEGAKPSRRQGPGSSRPDDRSTGREDKGRLAGTSASQERADASGEPAMPAAQERSGATPRTPPPAARAPIASPSSDTDSGGAEPGEGEFGALLEKSLAARAFEDGESVTGTIVAIGPDVAFLDIGGKSEATIETEELKDEEGDIEVEVGDTIEALVVSSEGGLRLSRKLARGAAAKEQLGDAFRAGLPVEGKVEKTIKGGYEVRIAGQRAFCPFSQIDLHRAADPAVHEGRVYTFRIVEYKEGGRNLVVSRRQILQEEERRRAEETKKSIVPGATLTGRVVSVREYGAFVDLGGIQGLVHVSEMGWARVATAADVVKVGDEVSVKVLKIDEEKGKISLGMKQLLADPWSRVSETYTVGQVVRGKVVRLQDFGAFVELEPGIEGLAHVSTFAPTSDAGGWKRAVPAGEMGEFEVLSIDLERKRIGIAWLGEGSVRAARARTAEERASAASEADPSAVEGGESRSPRRGGGAARTAIQVGDRITGKIERHENFGVFVYLAPGRTGLMPAAETGTQRGADLKKAFPVGSELEVMVLDIDPSGRRIRLSRKAMLEAEEKSDAREFATRHRSQETFGSIGEKLRAALAAKQK